MTLFHITQVLSNCSMGHSTREIVIIDSNLKALKKLNFETPGVIVYDGYIYNGKVIRRLKKTGIQVELKEANLEESMNILYNT